MHIFKRGVKEMRKKAAALAAVAIVLVSLGAGSTAEAGWGSIIGAGIQIGVQYAQIDKAMKYYDGEGRGEFFEMMKEKYGVNEDEELNARLDVIMANQLRISRTTISSIRTRALTPFARWGTM